MRQATVMMDSRIQSVPTEPAIDRIRIGLKYRLSVMKIPLSTHIGLTAILGYLIQRPNLSLHLIWLTVGIILLATGAATLNNYQERKVDALYKRTKSRPLPANKIHPLSALLQGFLLIIAGSTLFFYHSTTFLPVILGWTAIVLYNLVYTNLKPRTLHAVFPGALCGMLPPYIGWIYAGGEMLSYQILLLMVTMGIWQIPHYWIILMRHRADYVSPATIPNPLNILSERQLKKTVFVWIAAFSCLILLPILSGQLAYKYAAWLLFLNAASLILVSHRILFTRARSSLRFLHIYLSSALTFFLLASGLDRLI